MKALFLDRDGVINHDTGYLSKIKDLRFIKGIFKFCRKANEKGYKIIIITNQSGIGRGYYTSKEFKKLMNYIIQEFNRRNIEILDYFYSPYFKYSKYSKFRSIKFKRMRKPNIGMVVNAKKKYNLNLKKSIFIGDSKADLELAKKINFKCFLFLNKLKTKMLNKFITKL